MIPYNQKWLPRDAQHKWIPEHLRVSFNPVTVWVEDRWLLCRRMSGDYLCRVLFYHFCTFIWEHNGFIRPEVLDCQDSLITSVFKTDIREFKNNLSEPVQVMTWDGSFLVWMSTKQIHDMFLETCLIGPLAAMFGREFQQYLLVNKKANKIPRAELEYSVNSGRTSMSDARISTVRHERLEDGREHHERAYQASKRTRTPRKRSPQTPQRAPWKRSPTNRCDVEMSDHYDDRQPRDIRERPDYERLREGLRGSLAGDVRDRDYDRREGDRRGSKGDRRDYTPSEPREPRPYNRRPRSHDREHKERSRRRD